MKSKVKALELFFRRSELTKKILECLKNKPSTIDEIRIIYSQILPQITIL